MTKEIKQQLNIWKYNSDMAGVYNCQLYYDNIKSYIDQLEKENEELKEDIEDIVCGKQTAFSVRYNTPADEKVASGIFKNNEL